MSQRLTEKENGVIWRNGTKGRDSRRHCSKDWQDRRASFYIHSVTAALDPKFGGAVQVP